MTNILQTLLSLGQAGTSQPFLDNEEREEEVPLSERGIVVPGLTSPRKQAEDMPLQPLLPEDYTLDNSRDIAYRDEAYRRGQAIAREERRGLFGQKGALRDILGILGDAFLVQAGKDPVYGPQREREKLADALAGYTRDPNAAIERAMRDNPEAAMGIYKSQQEQALRGQENAIEGFRENRLRLQAARNEVSQLFARASAIGSPEAYQAAMDYAQNVSKAFDIPLEELGITPNMSQTAQEVLAGRSATANQNLTLPIRQQMADVAEGNLDVRRGMLGVALRNARTAEQRAKVYQEAMRNAMENRDLDNAMEFYRLWRNEQEKSNRDKPATSSTKGGNKTLRPKVTTSGW